MASWRSFNYDQPTPDVTKPFSIICPKQTDIYDKPPSTHRFDAPVIYATTTAGAFRSAGVTVQADWTYQYDQGGLCLIINIKDGSRKWVKAGVEFVEGQPWISVVTKDRWADWSLRPLVKLGSKAATISLEIHDDGALWVFAVDDQGKKQPVREVTWWADIDSDTEIHVGPASAKPSKEGGDLIVNFSDFSLETA